MRHPVCLEFNCIALFALGWPWLVTGIEIPQVAASEISQQEQAFFETKIRPVLAEHCYECHAGDSKLVRGGLLLDSREAIRTGGDNGPAVVPGDVEQSLLIAAMRHETFEMPPRKKLPDAVIADFEKWITRGALDPRDQGRGDGPKRVDFAKGKTHWAFQTIQDPDPPAVQNAEWVHSPIDRFVLRQLEANQMTPALPAAKATLIRRATFDLIGLPPTEEEVNAFLADESPDAFAQVIDRLLASPHYGERWGRHWLDLVRYADTNGADENHQMPVAWRYRDWVVRQMNADLPFDQFITQQLAGDLLVPPSDEQEAGELLTATGMLIVGPKMLAEQDKAKMLIDIVDEQVDTISKTMLGLTIACARCHDHKFDPIRTEDYYALAGIFASTKSMANQEFVSKWLERPLPSAEIEQQRAEHQKQIDQAKSVLEKLTAEQKVAEKEKNKEQTTAFEKKVKEQTAAVKKLEEAMPPLTMVMAADRGTPHDLPVHIRGNHLTLAKETTPRGVPEILSRVAPAPTIPDDESGRQQLADWLTSSQQPLTARVMVNRVWMWHFGEGLVRSPSNFGFMGEKPTHPELLDWLAHDFMRSGWSLKQLHRTIMLSATYQMQSESSNLEDAERDPENRLLGRQNRKRLEAEPIRDSILAVGGELDRTVGGKAPNTDAKRRAIYLPINRSALFEMFSTFDYVETANHIEQRPTTVVPHQALFLLNSPLVHAQSQRLAQEVAAAQKQPELRVAWLFQRLFARQPTPAETERSLQFVAAAQQLAQRDQAADSDSLAGWAALARTLIASNEFIYID
ncbi:PSD1 and planctomycete cytochrome C domain-containing protein [Blastopirellula marina]|uniref:Cytochrome c domain-containing protein n=1 Tax=Blastopirellula marina TaxID=124 RepID=A0A2S8GA45_9BACT|nr:PSD1 and planctomycete cytochrome C domain-containing protein [Blastopirellula marina]PQO41180.1 hypothetical protein C5Y98_04300 [Blastopirellula marina]PTL46056.1 DUF1553 domain-containing protein [Blastopirellula marina]